MFASADVTPTEPAQVFAERCATVVDAKEGSNINTNVLNVDVRPASIEVPTVTASVESNVDSHTESSKTCENSKAISQADSKKERMQSFEDDVASVRLPSREPSEIRDIPPTTSKEESVERKEEEVREKEKEGETASVMSSVVSVSECSKTEGPEVTPGVLAAVRAPVAPLAVCEDVGVDDDNVDKVPSVPPQRLSVDSKAASESDATKKIAHRDELSSVSESDIVMRDSKSGVSERKQRNDICPWEDE